MQHQLIKSGRHQHGKRSSGNKPVQPRNINAKRLADEVYRNHVLRRRSFYAYIPYAVNLRHGNHQHACKTAFQRYAESFNHAHNNGDKAGNARRCARHKKA